MAFKIKRPVCTLYVSSHPSHRETYVRTPIRPNPIHQLAALTPEQEARRYQMQQQVAAIDEQVQAKTEEKFRIDKEIDALLAEKRR